MRVLLAAIAAVFLVSSSPVLSKPGCKSVGETVAEIKDKNPAVNVVAVFTGKDAKRVRVIYNSTPPFSRSVKVVDKAVIMFLRGARRVFILLSSKGCVVGLLGIYVQEFRALWPKVSLDAVQI